MMNEKLILTSAGLRCSLISRPMQNELVAVDFATITMPSCIPLSRTVGHGIDNKSLEVALTIIASELLALPITKSYSVCPKGYRSGRSLNDCVVIGVDGSSDNCMLSFSGKAFVMSDMGFCERLYQFCKSNPSCHITRVDLAYDDFTGEIFNPQQVERDWQAGLFKNRGQNPKLHREGDLDRGDPHKLGLTIYVGCGGKVLCVYEKGIELGNKDDDHCRGELRYSSKEYVILPDIFRNPTAFFCGAYPYLATKLSLVNVDRSLQSINLERCVRDACGSFEKTLRLIKKQYGRHIRTLREYHYFESDKDLLDELQSDDQIVPKALQNSMDMELIADMLAQNLNNGLNSAI